MTPFFQTPEQLAALYAEAQSWEGTPFFAHSCAKGPTGGVDCVNLVQEILATQGAIERQTFPVYPMDWADHQAESIVLGTFANSPHFAERFTPLPFPGTDPLPGDVLCFFLGRCVHHIGIMIDARHFIHAMQPTGAAIMPLDVAFGSRRVIGKIVRIYRPTSRHVQTAEASRT